MQNLLSMLAIGLSFSTDEDGKRIGTAISVGLLVESILNRKE